MGQGFRYPDPPLLQKTQEMACQLRCLTHGAVYTLPFDLVSEAALDVLDIHLQDPLCQAELDDNNVLIKIPFTGCGSKVLVKITANCNKE